MTEHTPKQIALAERIAWIVVPRSSPDWQVAFDASLAAIVEVSELAAKHATAFLVGDPRNDVPLRNPMAHEIAAALRNGDHLP